MILTPEEAKILQCRAPGLMQVQRLANGPVNIAFANCEAANCMHWRWANPLRERGYCGLAGKPTENE